MGRPKRIQFPGACYLVSLLGNNRQDLFLSNQDRRFFLGVLRSHKDRHALKVYAFCLQPGAVSLLIETGHGNLSQVMQSFCTLYTKYFNGAHNTTGHVFQGRYKAHLVDKEAFLAEITGTVHLSPYRAGLTQKPWRFQWSSCSAYVESDLKEPLVDSSSVLKRFGKTRFIQSVRYLRYLKDRMKPSFRPELPVRQGLYIGGEAFAARMEALSGRPPVHLPAAADPAKIVAEVAVRHGVSTEKLLGRSQWREVVSVRKEAVHRLWKEARLGITEIARLFNRTPSAISQLIRALENPFAKPPAK